jgi:hypothetical protein
LRVVVLWRSLPLERQDYPSSWFHRVCLPTNALTQWACGTILITIEITIIIIVTTATGTIVSNEAPLFCILTTRGEVAVEDLTIGELVTTTNGASPVKWIGRTTLRRNASGSWHPSVLPIRVARLALDDQTPTGFVSIPGARAFY